MSIPWLENKDIGQRLGQLLVLVIIALIFGFSLPGAGAEATGPLVTEVLYDPTTTEPDGEWFELYNPGSSAVDLSNYKVGDEETSGNSEGMYQFPAGASIASGQVLVVANNATAFAANYGFDPDYELTNSSGVVPDMVKYTAWANGSIALANSGDELLLLDGSDALVDAVSWGSSNWAFNPDAPDVSAGNSIERNPADVDTDSANDWQSQSSPNPGLVSASIPPTATPTSDSPTSTPTVTPDGSCGKSSSYTAVWEIQGNGPVSPLDGQSVSNVRGIVTADFQAGTGGPYEPRGFFVQAHEGDCDTSTSDGILVYTATSTKNINVGDLVEIDNASVTEYQGPSSFTWEDTVTELSCTNGCQVSTLQNNYGLPTPEEYMPPTDEASAATYNEAREGMLMQVTEDATVVTPSNAYNEFVVRRGLNMDRIHHDENASGELIMVDGDGVSAAQCGQDGFGYIKTFDTVVADPAGGNLIYGPLNYNFNMYKIQQDDDAYCVTAIAGDDSSYDPADNPPPTGDSDTLTIASMNAWNFFDTDDDPHKNDPIATNTDYDRQSAKLAAAICEPTGLNQPFIIGLQEVENLTVLQQLASDVAANCGADYAAYTSDGPDDRSIQVGFLVRTDVVTVLSVSEEQGCSSTNWGINYESGDEQPSVNCSGGTPYYLFNRPPLHLEAELTLAGQTQSVHLIANHFKSKLSSSTCSISDCTDRRVEQAQHVDGLVDNLLAADANANVVVMGDLNDYYHSDPLDQLDETYGVLTNLWGDLAGPPSSGQGTIARYSYIHNGTAQTLDHILVSAALNSLTRLVSPRHVNADWPASHQNDTTMFSSSDHDFLVAAFDFAGSSPTPTSTPLPTATNTPLPTATSTPLPTATSTPLPTATNTPAPTATNTPAPTATSAPAATMHVADLDSLSVSANRGRWDAYVTISVVDQNGVPLSGVSVSGDWAAGANGSANCVTDGNGQCVVSKYNIKNRESSVSFTVTDLSDGAHTYEPIANSDPDGDSDGTTILVDRP